MSPPAAACVRFGAPGDSRARQNLGRRAREHRRRFRRAWRRRRAFRRRRERQNTRRRRREREMALPGAPAPASASPGAPKSAPEFPGAPTRFGVAGGAGEHTRRNFSIHMGAVSCISKNRSGMDATTYDFAGFLPPVAPPPTARLLNLRAGHQCMRRLLVHGPTSTQERASKRRSLAGGAVARCASSAGRPQR